MMRIILFISLIFLCSCSEAPQPINYGKDECSECKMTVMDEKFGAEIITTKGKVYKFDDIVCMVQFLNSGAVDAKENDRKLVINYEIKNDFIDAATAFYYVSDDLHSPMGGNTAAFKTKNAADNFKKDKTGMLISWNEVSIKLN